MKPSLIFGISLIVAALFCVLIFAMDFRLDAFPHLPDKGPDWYFWKLPEGTFLARLTAWGLYILHQVIIWVIVFKAMKEKGHPDRVSKLNILALGINFVFIILHFIQTHLFYDGLAQDVTIWSSQYSVIGMLIIILLMLIPRRGLFWGLKANFPKKVQSFVRKYHGFYISWALVYTFWFHPMEGDYAILSGFAYMFFLFIQLSMFGTRIHFNIYWITFLEFFVGVHGVLVAIMNGQAIWPMFLFGFLFMTVCTQIHGFKFKPPAKIVISLLYVAGAVAAYYFRGYQRAYEITFIPATLYIGVFVLAFSVWGIVAVRDKIKSRIKGKPA
ncbi:MAG: hypothetical protein JW969_01590 [Spirochaetales bacterium]|nr:hypothetical protein [Spirochaetales bacterium]